MRRMTQSVFPARLSLSLRREPRRRGSPSRPRSVPLRLEQLEDRITPSAPGITTLASFDGTNGATPVGGLVMDSSGNLYGTTQLGGTSGKGTVFVLPHGSSTITTLASIPNNVGLPEGGLVMDGDGNLYGATQELGGLSGGILYELAKGSGTIKTLATFNDTDGSNPDAGLVMDGDGNLYGTTGKTLFELAKGSGTITTLATFQNTGGVIPTGGLVIDGAGNLYGASPTGGIGYGVVFELAQGSSTVTLRASFAGSSGTAPFAGVILDGSGNLYGTAYQGGADDYGTVFELAKGSGTITALASFNGTNGFLPETRLVMDDNGNLFGTINGSASAGAVFEVVKGSGTITTIASFNGANGSRPDGYPIIDGTGTLYGTTANGGKDNFGTVYKLQTEAPRPSQLVFLQQPRSTDPGALVAPVTVAIEDQFGNIETADDSDTLTLALGANPSRATLGGTTTLTVHGGMATFSDLSIDQIGNGFTLTVSTNVGGIGPVTSHSFNVTSGGSGGTGGGPQGGSGGAVSFGGLSLSLPAPGQSAGFYGLALEMFEFEIDQALAFLFASMGRSNPQNNEAVAELLNAINSDPLYPTGLGWYACFLGFEAALSTL